MLNDYKYNIQKSLFFAEDMNEKELCKKTLNEKDLARLSEAIEDLYYFEFVIGEEYFISLYILLQGSNFLVYNSIC